MKNTTFVQNLVVRNRHFTIVFDGKYYLAIDHKYITDGKLNTTLRGPQMGIADTLDWCIENTKNNVEVDYLVEEQGYTYPQAFCKVFNMWDSLEAIEGLFANK